MGRARPNKTLNDDVMKTILRFAFVESGLGRGWAIGIVMLMLLPSDVAFKCFSITGFTFLGALALAVDYRRFRRRSQRDGGPD